MLGPIKVNTMTNHSSGNQADSLAATQPAPNSLSDTPPNGYDATIGSDAAKILAEIEANNNTPPDALRRLCVVFGCAGAISVLIWYVVQSNIITRRWFDATINNVQLFTTSQEACRLSGGKNSWWPKDPIDQGNLWLANSGWCTGMTPEAKANLSRWVP